MHSPGPFIRLILILCCLSVFLISCNSPYTSRKKAYYHVEMPERSYRLFDSLGFPFSFEYPVYASLVQDSTYFDSTPENPFWLNLDFGKYNARIFLSYKLIGGKAPLKVRNADGSYRDSSGVNTLDNLVNDAFNLTAKNDAIASSIRDSAFINPQGVYGVFFKVGGNAATARQFFVTDSSRHFLRGALYFESTPNMDSLKPFVDFFGADMERLVNSIRWRD